MIKSESDLVLIKTKNGKDLLFEKPYIYRKNILKFSDFSIEDVNAEYDREMEAIVLDTKTKKFKLLISDEDVNWLNNFYDDEYTKANQYFNSLCKNTANLLINKDSVESKELVENRYNPYYFKIFEYQLNHILGTKDLKYDELKKEILNKIDLTKYEEEQDENYSGYKVVPIKDIKFN